MGPSTFPAPASPMPIERRMGVTVPWLIVSPTPAMGPMRPDFTELMASSSMSAPFARCSSMAITAPWMTPPTFGSVLKKTRCRRRAALISSGSLYSFRMIGVIACAKAVPCSRS
jgi:hypothetical protein